VIKIMIKIIQEIEKIFDFGKKRKKKK